MASVNFPAILVILCGILSTTQCNFVTFYMDKKEGATVSADSVRVETSLTRVYQANVKATVTVTAAAGFPILTAYFRRFDLETVKGDGTCYDYFNIYDGSSVSATRLNAKPLCGSTLSVTRYNSTGRTLTFEFVTDGTAEMTGVEVIVTSVIKGTCTDTKTQFQCSDKMFCISSSLRCEAYTHCADGSDEASALCAAIAAETNSILYGIIIGSLVGGSALIILFVFLIYYCVREHKYKRLIAQLRLERLRKTQVGPVVENEYPVTNRYRKQEFKAMFRNEDIENKDWGLYHGPLFCQEHYSKKAKEGQKLEMEKEVGKKDEIPTSPEAVPGAVADSETQKEDKTKEENKREKEEEQIEKKEDKKKEKEHENDKEEKEKVDGKGDNKEHNVNEKEGKEKAKGRSKKGKKKKSDKGEVEKEEEQNGTNVEEEADLSVSV